MYNLNAIKIYLLENKSWLIFRMLRYLSRTLFKVNFKTALEIYFSTRLQEVETEYDYR
jgi:hypothetical protein